MTDFDEEYDVYVIREYWPTKTKKDFPDVPAQIAAAASEAHICLGAGSPRGAVALARAVVESVAKDKGIHKGHLQLKIDALHQKSLISSNLKEAAHEIRVAGNEAAHGDLVAEQLRIEDAGIVISFMDNILDQVYQGPASVESMRQRRKQREAKSNAEPTGMDLIQKELGGQVIGEIEPPSGYSDEPPF